MKITETVERECCRLNDLKYYRAEPTGAGMRQRYDPRFCIHCGQIWVWVRRPDGAGSSEDARVRWCPWTARELD